MKQYVLGFAFDPPKERVLLIQKNRPDWQAGRLNGIGGKVERNETLSGAMAREFYEETGFNTHVGGWRHFATMQAPKWRVFAFAHMDMDFLPTPWPLRAASETEQLFLERARGNPSPSWLSNLHWLIPLALDTGEVHGRPTQVQAGYSSMLP